MPKSHLSWQVYAIIIKMKNMKNLLVSAIVLLTILTGCKPSNLQQYRMISFDSGFDTFFTLVGYTDSEEKFIEYFQLMEKEAYHYHQLFDKYHEYEGINNIYTINQMAGIAPVVVDKEIINLLLLSKQWSEETNGIFDITLGSVLSIWHDYREEGIQLNDMGLYGTIPPYEDLLVAYEYVGWQYIEIDEEKQTVYLTDARVSLDVGSVAKGYAVEMIALKLEEAGLKYASVSGGGNVRTINSKPDGSSWNISVRTPNSMVNESLALLSILTSYSVVTSGDYERYYIAEGDLLLHHIIDPRTLMPTKNARSVTVVYPDSGIADILSTVFAVYTYDEGVAFLNQYNAEHPDNPIGVLWVFTEPQNQYEGYREIQSQGFTLYISNSLIEIITIDGD
jgi:Membrane-associated lipoprotein involved in thiamine biosynthesis